ncbi:hypothetical protein [Planococcus dechangensis]|uniref:Uncharacterized protein n=1 Tax=Planococcus dechangensis TaxID=1176255 RepID=A0ABV9ME74_9BACL
MHINVVLGNLIDSSICVKELKDTGEEFIVVLDYDLRVDKIYKNDIEYISPEYATRLVKEFQSIRYFKSLYILPGMYKETN